MHFNAMINNVFLNCTQFPPITTRHSRSRQPAKVGGFFYLPGRRNEHPSQDYYARPTAHRQGRADTLFVGLPALYSPGTQGAPLASAKQSSVRFPCSMGYVQGTSKPSSLSQGAPAQQSQCA